jgi:hypothetical protein
VRVEAVDEVANVERKGLDVSELLEWRSDGEGWVFLGRRMGQRNGWKMDG